jgi:hypothetical protein
MRLLGPLVVVAVLLLPAPVDAQSVKLADLVGTWKGGEVDSTGKITRADSVTFRADSTSNWNNPKNFERIQYLKGDTIAFSPQKVKITIANQQLSVTSFDKKWAYNFTRVNTPTPKP